MVATLRRRGVRINNNTVKTPPVDRGRTFRFAIQLPNQLTRTQRFRSVIIRMKRSNALVQLQSVNQTRLNSRGCDFSIEARNGLTTNLLMCRLPNDGTLSITATIHSHVARLRRDFPPKLQTRLIFSAASFIQISLQRILVALIRTILLMLLVLFVFLRS